MLVGVYQRGPHAVFVFCAGSDRKAVFRTPHIIRHSLPLSPCPSAVNFFGLCSIVSAETIMKVLFCGSRTWTDESCIETAISECCREASTNNDKLIVIHGNASRGADAIVDRTTKRLGIETIRVDADWEKFGRIAGFLRNQKMLDDHADIMKVYAFRSDGKSSGTDDMVSRAVKKINSFSHRTTGNASRLSASKTLLQSQYFLQCLFLKCGQFPRTVIRYGHIFII